MFWCHLYRWFIRAVANLSLPGGQYKNVSSIFFIFLYFPSPTPGRPWLRHCGLYYHSEAIFFRIENMHTVNNKISFIDLSVREVLQINMWFSDLRIPLNWCGFFTVKSQRYLQKIISKQYFKKR